MIMNERQERFKARIQDFLNFHFPNDKHTFKDYCNDFYVTVGEELNSKLVFNVVGTSIYRLTINKDHYDSIAPIFGLDNVDRTQFEIVNDLLLQINENESFTKFFEPIDKIDFKNVLKADLEESYGEYEVTDSVVFRIQPKFSKKPFTCGIQFDWHFEDMTDNTKLKGILALCLTSKQPVRFALGFDIENKVANIVTAESNSYTEFFEKNTVLELDSQMKTYLHDFLSMLIEKNAKESFDSKGIELNDFTNLLAMTEI